MRAEPEFVGDPDWPTLDWIEREYIEARLRHFNGNKTWTAKSLGIALKTLYNKLGKYQQFDSSTFRKAAPRELSERQRENARLDREVSRIAHELCTAPLATVVPKTLHEKRTTAWKRPHGKDGRFRSIAANAERQEMRL